MKQHSDTHVDTLPQKPTQMLLPSSYVVILYFYSLTLMLKQTFYGSVQLPATVSAQSAFHSDVYVVLLNSGAKNHHHISLILFYASLLMKHLSAFAQGLTSVKLFSTPPKAICFQIWLYIL